MSHPSPKSLINLKIPNSFGEKEVFEEFDEGCYCQRSGIYKLARATESPLPLVLGLIMVVGPVLIYERKGSCERKYR